MKPSKQQLAQYLAAPLSGGVKAALVYGANGGLASQTADGIVKTLTAAGYEIVPLTSEAIIAESQILAEQMLSMGLFAPKKLIYIKNAADGLGKIVTEVAPHLSDDCYLLITAGELSTSSKLRKLFETDAALISIACYPEEGESSARMLLTFLKERDIKLDDEALRYVRTVLPNDRALALSELEKLHLCYEAEGGNLSSELLRQLIRAEEESDLQSVYEAFYGGDLKGTLSEIHALIVGGESPIALVRAMLWYNSRLKAVRLAMGAGKDYDSALRALRPPVFFKQLQTFRNHIQKNSLKRLMRLEKWLLMAEAEFKYGSDIASHSIYFKFMEPLRAGA